ncbi:hypothetical protein E2C01_030042 [Portunus trituberculatus]|uniref:Endonuclease/exonuclease/phosphatase domain-containing protein n=1 Tax=Portunus trituberculatus TaxID=210409 RepID=A0A5B7ETL7_PORTR|nr:hypothetical protein [Portunus trituberculatus]
MPAEVNMDADMTSFTPLSGSKCLAPSSLQDTCKVQRTAPSKHQPQDTCVKASFLIRAANGARVFSNPHCLPRTPLLRTLQRIIHAQRRQLTQQHLLFRPGLPKDVHALPLLRLQIRQALQTVLTSPWKQKSILCSVTPAPTRPATQQSTNSDSSARVPKHSMWPNCQLEIAAARVMSARGWLSVAICYSPLGLTTLPELNHYLSLMSPPVILMGDFNAHHQCWEPNLPLHLTNTSGRTLFKAILDSPHLSLLSPPGLTTCYHPHTGAPSVLDLFIGDPSFSSAAFSTGPYMGSGHLPIHATFPIGPSDPQPGCLPRWKIQPSGWPGFTEAQSNLPDFSLLPLEEAASTITETLVKAGRTAFHLSTHRSSRRPVLHSTVTASILAPTTPGIAQLFTPQELHQVLSSLKPGKSASPDSRYGLKAVCYHSNITGEKPFATSICSSRIYHHLIPLHSTLPRVWTPIIQSGSLGPVSHLTSEPYTPSPC